MPGYPNLFPSGFLEYEKDSCQGPILYRSQPSRETPGITQLNDVVSKYGSTQYKGGDFLRLASNLKQTSRMWNRLPPSAKNDFLELIVSSNSQMARDIIRKYCPKEEVVSVRENFGEHRETDVNKQSILTVVVIAIVSLVIGFLIASSCS